MSTPTEPTLYKNGKPLARASTTYAAYNATAGWPRAEDPKRVSLDYFRKWLHRQGITEPDTTTWVVELPNGVTLAYVVPEHPLTAAQRKQAFPEGEQPEAKATGKPRVAKAPSKRAAKAASDAAMPSASAIIREAKADPRFADFKVAHDLSKMRYAEYAEVWTAWAKKHPLKEAQAS